MTISGISVAFIRGYAFKMRFLRYRPRFLTFRSLRDVNCSTENRGVPRVNKVLISAINHSFPPRRVSLSNVNDQINKNSQKISPKNKKWSQKFSKKFTKKFLAYKLITNLDKKIKISQKNWIEIKIRKNFD